MAIPPEPVVFAKFPSSIIGPNETIYKPKSTEQLDYEVELVCVVGKKGKNISEKDALSHLVGFTVGLFISY
jgi:2-keto-4-pentenoate hydratase/2-oxohepta-3-ene-1,7-dioic acid hydratase in catechol pathway